MFSHIQAIWFISSAWHVLLGVGLEYNSATCRRDPLLSVISFLFHLVNIWPSHRISERLLLRSIRVRFFTSSQEVVFNWVSLVHFVPAKSMPTTVLNKALSWTFNRLRFNKPRPLGTLPIRDSMHLLISSDYWVLSSGFILNFVADTRLSMLTCLTV